MSVEIRAATESDVEHVLAVWAEARSAAARTPDDPDVVARLLERDPGALLVAEAGGVAETVPGHDAAWSFAGGRALREDVLAHLTGRHAPAQRGYPPAAAQRSEGRP